MRARRTDDERSALERRIEASLLRIKLIGALLVAALVIASVIAILLSRLVAGPGR
jgi:hypothetical protein